MFEDHNQNQYNQKLQVIIVDIVQLYLNELLLNHYYKCANELIIYLYNRLSYLNMYLIYFDEIMD